jgi:hypothetical protein
LRGVLPPSKAVAAGKDGRALYIAALCYCADNLTDGQIPKAAVRFLAAEADVKPAAATAVTKAALWSDEGDHYLIRDFVAMNRSRDKAIDEREKAAERKRAERERKSRHQSQRDTQEESQRDMDRSHALDIDDDSDTAVVCTTDNDEMPGGVTGSSSVVEQAALVYGFAQAATSAATNPSGYAKGVVRNVLAEQGERLRAYVAEHPSADAEAVAANVFKLDRWALIGARKAMS